jgi:hypothetical protein
MTTMTQQPCVLRENPDVVRADFFLLPASPWMKGVARQLMEMYGVTENDLTLSSSSGDSEK